jgi:hypothetical protein
MAMLLVQQSACADQSWLMLCSGAGFCWDVQGPHVCQHVAVRHDCGWSHYCNHACLVLTSNTCCVLAALLPVLRSTSAKLRLQVPVVSWQLASIIISDPSIVLLFADSIHTIEYAISLAHI